MISKSKIPPKGTDSRPEVTDERVDLIRFHGESGLAGSAQSTACGRKWLSVFRDVFDDQLHALVGEVVVDGEPVGHATHAADGPADVGLMKRDRVDALAT